MSNNDMEFYRGKDEDAFLGAWENKYGTLSEDEVDALYIKITEEIDRQVESGEHEIGDLFIYEGVKVGKSDYNQFHEMYLFEEEK